MPEQKTGPRDVFGNLLAMLGLYVSVIFFGTLLFAIIDTYFPNVPLENYYRNVDLIWPLSILIIVFPLFLWVTWYMERDLYKNPAKRELKIRKWLIYFTLFVASLIIVGDLVALIYRYLNGDIITTGFVLKVLSVLTIALIVFIYYAWQLRHNMPAISHPTMRFFVYGVVALALATIVLGFSITDSPATKRAMRLDERRINDLSSLQYQIVNYWQTKNMLPQDLNALRDDITGFIPPVDPETNVMYEYTVTGTRTFELCADFKTANNGMGEKGRMAYPTPMYEPYAFEGNWSHDTGHTCFTRTIDPDKFPPIKGRI